MLLQGNFDVTILQLNCWQYNVYIVACMCYNVSIFEIEIKDKYTTSCQYHEQSSNCAILSDTLSYLDV